jgi:Putative phage abortive infection protein
MEMPKNSEKQISKRRIPSYQFWAIFLIFLGVVIGGIYIYLLIQNNTVTAKSDIDITKIGAFGDFIGGAIGSLWALAGVFLFFQALKDQRQDIETNIQLLQLQIENLESSKLTTEQQSKILRIQQFETTFFSLLKLFNETTDNLEILHAKTENSVPEIIKGKKVFSVIVEKLNDSIEDKTLPPFIVVNKTKLTYKKIYHEYEEILEPYFGALYSILIFIDKVDLEISEKYTYSNTLRNCLTNLELLILSHHGRQYFRNDFKELFKKFNMLKHLPISICPELKFQKKNLDIILEQDKYPYPPNLSVISESIAFLLKQEFFERKGSHKMFFMSCISIWVYIKNNVLEVHIDVPTNNYRRELLKENSEIQPYNRMLNKLRKFDFCSLIEAVVYLNMVNKKFLTFFSIGDSKFLYETKREVYDKKNETCKVFKCTFTYGNIEDLLPPIDLDELTAIFERSQKNESETS